MNRSPSHARRSLPLSLSSHTHLHQLDDVDEEDEDDDEDEDVGDADASVRLLFCPTRGGRVVEYTSPPAAFPHNVSFDGTNSPSIALHVALNHSSRGVNSDTNLFPTRPMSASDPAPASSQSSASSSLPSVYYVHSVVTQEHQHLFTFNHSAPHVPVEEFSKQEHTATTTRAAQPSWESTDKLCPNSKRAQLGP